MPDISLGTWLRQERERRGITLKGISDQTKVSAPLLEGLESDNLSRWPDGIYRRAFVRAYASAVGLDPDEVARRFEEEHGACTDASGAAVSTSTVSAAAVAAATHAPQPAAAPTQATRSFSTHNRVLGTTADLTVALVLALGSAAAGSRLLWPVLFIAAYYAIGILLTGTSPMVALLQGEEPAPPPVEPMTTTEDGLSRGVVERRHQPRRNAPRAIRPARSTRPRVQ